MARYAENTTVSISKSRDQIEVTLERFGASQMAWLRDDEAGSVTVAFKKGERTYKFTLHRPDPETFRSNPKVPRHHVRHHRTDLQVENAVDQEWRRLFRSLQNYIKATLDAVDSGILSFDQAMLPYLVLPGGQTVSEQAERQLAGLGTVDLSKALTVGRGDPPESPQGPR